MVQASYPSCNRHNEPEQEERSTGQPSKGLRGQTGGQSCACRTETGLNNWLPLRRQVWSNPSEISQHSRKVPRQRAFRTPSSKSNISFVRFVFVFVFVYWVDSERERERERERKDA